MTDNTLQGQDNLLGRSVRQHMGECTKLLQRVHSGLTSINTLSGPLPLNVNASFSFGSLRGVPRLSDTSSIPKYCVWPCSSSQDTTTSSLPSNLDSFARKS